MNPVSAFSDIFKLVYDPTQSRSYYPDEKLKSKPAILLDQLSWLARNKEVNKNYFIYGLDRKNSNLQSEVIPYKEFRKIRDAKNLHPPGLNFNYAALFRDKFVFGQLLKSLRFPTPESIALFVNGRITWLDCMRVTDFSELSRTDVSFDGFCKKLTGIGGEGAFPLKVDKGKILIGDDEVSAEVLQAKMNGPYLCQQRIIQHESMAALHPHSVNTVRLISFNNNGNIQMFSCILKMGTNHSRVDNFQAGGIAIAIDLDTGKTKKKGINRTGLGSGVTIHPNSGISLLDLQLPFFEEMVEMTKRLHTCCYGTHSVGWDIAFTADGPVFVEGNDDWGGTMPMAVEENFKTRFLKMYNETPYEPIFIDRKYLSTGKSS